MVRWVLVLAMAAAGLMVQGAHAQDAPSIFNGGNLNAQDSSISSSSSTSQSSGYGGGYGNGGGYGGAGQGDVQGRNSAIPSISNIGPSGSGLQLMMDPDPVLSQPPGGARGRAGQQGAQRNSQYPQNQQDLQGSRRGKPERHEFQDLVAQSLGRDLPFYGADLFAGVPTTFSPTNIVPVTPDYVVGPGDEIVINGWGQVDINYRAVVDRDGTITVPRVGSISVAGLKVQALESHLRAAIGRVFANFDLRVTMGRLRAMQIYVVGQAKRPGTYTVSSLSTLVNVLFASGGPSVNGSLRKVQVKRGDKVFAEFDLYEFLLKGDKSKDVHLLPGDVVFIPPVGALAAIAGSVTNPAIFETRPGDRLADLIQLAGGLTVTAAGQKVMVERIANRQARQVEDFALDKAGLDKPLRDGDLVRVLPLSPRFDNAITVRGNVDTIARHPWRDGLRVRDVIPDREALIARDYWAKRNRLVRLDTINREQEESRMRDLREGRRPDDDYPYARDWQQRAGGRDAAGRDAYAQNSGSQNAYGRNDRAGQYGSAAAAAQGGQRVGAASQREQQEQQDSDREQRNAGLTQYQSAVALRQERFGAQVSRSLPEVNWDYAVIERLNWNDLTTQLIPFNLGKAVLDGDPTQNIVLQPGDVITVFSKDDIQVPLAKRSVFVRLEGEITVAGVYQARAGETLRQLVARVGGLTPRAYLYGAQFERESTRAMQQKRLDESVDRLAQDVERNFSSSAGLSKEEAESARAIADTQNGLIARLRKVRATGRIVLEMPMGAVQLKDLPDLPLEDGDRFYVPPVPSTVAVVGAVYNPNSFIYRPEKRLNDYMSQSGGTTKGGDSDSVYLIRADGSVVSKRQAGYVFSRFEREPMMPGDTLVVPENLERYRLTRDLRDWSQIFYQFALGVAGIQVLRNN